MQIVMIVGVLSAIAPAKAVDADQMLRLVKSQYSLAKEISFLYEGDLRWVGQASILTDGKPENHGSDFQYGIVWRADGSAIIEGYIRSSTQGALIRYQKRALLKSRLEKVDMIPDMSLKKGQIQTVKTDSRVLYNAGFPPFLFWCFFFPLESLEPHDYKWLGVEEVDGHQCAVVSVARDPVSLSPNGPHYRFWIDLKRGGNPIVAEYYQDEQLLERTRVTKVREERLANGPTLWVPSRCEVESFGWNGRFYSEPVFRRVAYIVQGSLRLDRGLDDSRFTVAGKSILPDTEGLRALAKQFKDALEEAKPRTDPASVRMSLDKRLAEANQQSRELAASDPGARSTALIVQIALGVIGVCIGGAAILYKLRVG